MFWKKKGKMCNVLKKGARIGSVPCSTIASVGIFSVTGSAGEVCYPNTLEQGNSTLNRSPNLTLVLSSFTRNHGLDGFENFFLLRFDPPSNLIQADSGWSSPPRSLRRHSGGQISVAKRVPANNNVLDSSVSHSSVSTESRELKTAKDLLMDLELAGIHIP